METLEEKLTQLRAISDEKDQTEIRLCEVAENKQWINNPAATQPSIIVHESVFKLPQEINNRILTIIETWYTTRREQLIIEAEKIIGPTEHEAPKENETAPVNA